MHTRRHSIHLLSNTYSHTHTHDIYIQLHKSEIYTHTTNPRALLTHFCHLSSTFLCVSFFRNFRFIVLQLPLLLLLLFLFLSFCCVASLDCFLCVSFQSLNYIAAVFYTHTHIHTYPLTDFFLLKYILCSCALFSTPT